jgi:Fe-S-cluster-containing hydrogenase component 2
MSLAVIDHTKCKPNKCNGGICLAVEVCPTNAIDQETPFEQPYVTDGCYACNKCVESCPLHLFGLHFVWSITANDIGIIQLRFSIS